MKRIIEYLILSLILSVVFCFYGYIFTTAGMICLYATVYAITEGDSKPSN